MDIRVGNHFSLFVLYPLTDGGRDWVFDNVNPEAQRWCGGIVVEPRYMADIVEGARADGRALSPVRCSRSLKKNTEAVTPWQFLTVSVSSPCRPSPRT